MIVDHKELIALDKKLRSSPNAPLYNIREVNPYEKCVPSTSYVTLQRDRIDGEKQFAGLSADHSEWLTILYKRTLGKLPSHIRTKVALCGGSLFRVMKKVESEKIYDRGEFKTRATDIDLFLYNVENIQQAKEIVTEICYALSDQVKQNQMSKKKQYRNISSDDYNITRDNFVESRFYRTKNSITIKLIEPIKIADGISFDTVQIILRLYDTISQIIYGFDIQAAAFAMVYVPAGEDNKSFEVFSSEIAMFTLATQQMPVDTDRRSESFPRRLQKYMQMSNGVILVFPYLDPFKIAHVFAHTPFTGNEMWDQPYQIAARIVLKDTHLILDKRIDSINYVGHVAAITQKVTVVKQTDYDHLQSKYLRKMTRIIASNENLIRKYAQQQIQPNLIFPIALVKDVCRTINIKSLVGRLQRTADVTTIQFSLLYELEFRQVNPASQWTTSFDPIQETPQSWYGEFYTKAKYDHTQLITYMFSPEKLMTMDANAIEKRPDNFFLQTVLKASKGMVQQRLRENNITSDQFVQMNERRLKEYNTSDDQFIPDYALRELIVMNALKDTEDFSQEDLLAIVRLIVDVGPDKHFYEQFIDGLENVEKFWETNAVVRNTGLFKKTDMRNAILQTIDIMRHQFLKIYKQRNKTIKDIALSHKPFKWQVICSHLSDLTDTDLEKAARQFRIPITVDMSQREICKLLAQRTAELLKEWQGQCVNIEDQTLDLSMDIKDLPTELKWVRTVNGKTYCYKLEDLYQTLINGDNRDPRGIPLSEEQQNEIKERRMFLADVMTPFGFTLDSFASRSRETIVKAKQKEYENSVQGLSEAILEMIPYCPMDLYVFSKIVTEYLPTLYLNYQSLLLKRNRGNNLLNTTVEEILQTLKADFVKDMLYRLLFREVLTDFIDEQKELVESLREQEKMEQRFRLNRQ